MKPQVNKNNNAKAKEIITDEKLWVKSEAIRVFTVVFRHLHQAVSFFFGRRLFRPTHEMQKLVQ